jgi:FtsP/CotA-like multicopper oxidase with cupredoxin domain
MIDHKKNRKLSVIMITGLIILAVMAGPALGATYTLRAGQTTMAMGGETITMWGYALVSYNIGAGEVAGDNVVKIPGPRLTVTAGQGLRVNLINELAVPVSIIIPGQLEDSPEVTRNTDGRIRSFTRETPVGVENDTGSYSWSNLKPGTYLYHSGTHLAVQVQMGLYGGVTMNAVDVNRAQAYSGVEYDVEAMIIYSEIDPALHQAVAGGTYGTAAYPSTINYKPKYFLVNGAAAEADDPIVTIDADDTLLLRFLNAGLKDHAPEIIGSHLRVVAEDGNLYPYPRQHYALLLAAGKTLDAIFSPSMPGEDYSIFDRRSYRTNVPIVKGAMHTYIAVNDAQP